MSLFKQGFRISVALLVAGWACGKVKAQTAPVGDVAASYSFLQVVKGSNLTASGGGGSGTMNINNWLGVVGEFALYHSTPVGPGVDAGTYAAGPRVSYRHWNRFTPFAEFLVGGVRYSQNAFLLGGGGGVDIGLDRNGRFALRPQIDYLDFRPTNGPNQTLRYSASIVYRFGTR